MAAPIRGKGGEAELTRRPNVRLGSATKASGCRFQMKVTKETVMNRRMLTLVIALLAVPAAGIAQNPSAAQKAFMDAHQKMMSSMPKAMSGDADKDFATMMIPHHQGAIDMAKVELQHGKAPRLRAMAEKMIKDQEKEIAELRAWQAAHR